MEAQTDLMPSRTETAACESARYRFVGLALTLAALFAMAPTSFLILVRLANTSESYSYIGLIPVIALFLFYRDRIEIFGRLSHYRPAVALLGASGIAVAAVDRGWLKLDPATSITIAVMLAVAYTMAAFLLFMGPQAFRKAIFPLCFLFLMVPIPQTILNRIILFLQAGSTTAVSSTFSVLGIPFYREGFVLHFPTLSIEVARECSSIRSSTAMVVMVILISYLSLRSVWARLLLLTAMPIVIVTNAIRIVTLVLLTVYVDPRFLSSQLHRNGGVVFFLLGLGGVLVFAKLLSRLEQPPVPAQSPKAS